VRQHALTQTHKVVVAAHLEPDKPVRIILQSSLDDEQLLSGAVPQPADWLRVWRVCMDPMSWATAAEKGGTEHYIAQIRGRPAKPRAIQGMVSCMKEALRIRKRKWLDEAKWIFLGFDDKNGRKFCGSSAIPSILLRASTPRVRRAPVLRASTPRVQRAIPLGCSTEHA